MVLRLLIYIWVPGRVLVIPGLLMIGNDVPLMNEAELTWFG
jgi:hypothetical protein